MGKSKFGDSYENQKLTKRIRDFWARHVNSERIMGKNMTRHDRGEEPYFLDLENQRYRSHRHLLPWINSMKSGKSTLEIGCGIGLDTITMAKHGLRVTAADLTQVSVHAAKKRFERHHIKASFIVTDACYLPFNDNFFDYVYSFGVLHHIADIEQGIAEIHRVLKPGGEVKIMLYNRHSLNEIAHRITKIPYEDKDEMCPVVRRFTTSEVQKLFDLFNSCEIALDFVYGEGYGKLFQITPRWLYCILSRFWGWHIMISAQK